MTHPQQQTKMVWRCLSIDTLLTIKAIWRDRAQFKAQAANKSSNGNQTQVQFKSLKSFKINETPHNPLLPPKVNTPSRSQNQVRKIFHIQDQIRGTPTKNTSCRGRTLQETARILVYMESKTSPPTIQISIKAICSPHQHWWNNWKAPTRLLYPQAASVFLFQIRRQWRQTNPRSWKA